MPRPDLLPTRATGRGRRQKVDRGERDPTTSLPRVACARRGDGGQDGAFPLGNFQGFCLGSQVWCMIRR